MNKKIIDNLYKKEFKNSENELKKAYEERDILKTLSYLKYLSSFYYKINYKLTDDLLEDITYKISMDFLEETYIYNCDKSIVLFYDGFGLAFRGLANIYLKALLDLGYKIVYVLYEGTELHRMFEEIWNDYNNLILKVIPQSPIVERMKYLKQIVEESRAASIFLYTFPEDVAGIGTISTVKSNVKRYLIDLTDHAFWLGKCASDYFISFRNYGYNIAVQYRKIDKRKMILLPYYPDNRTSYVNDIMPFDLNRPFVFSGGSLYKIEGDVSYEKMVIYILENYRMMYFLFAGNGNSKVLNRLKIKFPNRFFQVNEQKNLGEIFKKAKFYLSTYPITGGLMCQFALKYNCIPLSLCKRSYEVSDVKTLLLHPERANFIFYDIKDLFQEIDKLMNDESYYYKAKKNLNGQLIDENSFRKGLKYLLNFQKTNYVMSYKNIDMLSFLEIYKENANSLKQYMQIILESNNKYVYKRHPIIVILKKLKIL